MAIEYARMTYVQRSLLAEGKPAVAGNAVALAAYIAHQEFTDVKTGEVFDRWKNEPPPEHLVVMLPLGSDLKNEKPEIITNAAEAAEKRKDAVVAKHLVLATPYGLTLDERIDLTLSFVDINFIDHGLAALVGFHEPDGDEGNPHAHVEPFTRRLGPDGFDSHKARDLDNEIRKSEGKAFVSEGTYWNKLWRAHQEAFFQERKIGMQVDPISETPGKHLDPATYRRQQRARGQSQSNRPAQLMSARELANTISSSGVKLKPIGQDKWNALCPFHEEKTPSFEVFKGRYRGEGRYHCHGCGADGDGIQWLQQVKGLTFSEAAGTLVKPDPEVIRREQEQKRNKAIAQDWRNRNPDSVVPDWFLENNPDWLTGKENIREAPPKINRAELLKRANLDVTVEDDGRTRPMTYNDVAREISPQYAKANDRERRRLNLVIKSEEGMKLLDTKLLTAQQNVAVRERELGSFGRFINSNSVLKRVDRGTSYWWRDRELEEYKLEERRAAKGLQTLGVKLRRRQHEYEAAKRETIGLWTIIREVAVTTLNQRRTIADEARATLTKHDNSPEMQHERANIVSIVQ